MRKVLLSMSVSLDGFVAGPKGELDWVFPHIDSELQQWIAGSLGECDTHLIGRVNFLEQARFWPTSTDALAPMINEVEKVVIGSTLDGVEWKNSRLAARPLADEINHLRQLPGKSIWVAGGARLAQSVSALGLVDEYRLVVHPVVLGTGLALFTDPVSLRLISAQTFDTGAIALTYQPA